MPEEPRAEGVAQLVALALGREPRTSLDEGIPKAVSWFLEHRAAHPEEDATVPSEGEGVGWKDELLTRV